MNAGRERLEPRIPKNQSTNPNQAKINARKLKWEVCTFQSTGKQLLGKCTSWMSHCNILEMFYGRIWYQALQRTLQQQRFHPWFSTSGNTRFLRSPFQRFEKGPAHARAMSSTDFKHTPPPLLVAACKHLCIFYLSHMTWQ